MLGSSRTQRWHARSATSTVAEGDRREVVAQLDLIRAQVGTRLRLKVDPADAGNLWINWPVDQLKSNLTP
jgi:hypothetical protein